MRKRWPKVLCDMGAAVGKVAGRAGCLPTLISAKSHPQLACRQGHPVISAARAYSKGSAPRSVRPVQVVCFQAVGAFARHGTRTVLSGADRKRASPLLASPIVRDREPGLLLTSRGATRQCSDRGVKALSGACRYLIEIYLCFPFRGAAGVQSGGPRDRSARWHVQVRWQGGDASIPDGFETMPIARIYFALGRDAGNQAECLSVVRRSKGGSMRRVQVRPA